MLPMGTRHVTVTEEVSLGGVCVGVHTLYYKQQVTTGILLLQAKLTCTEKHQLI